MLCWSGSLAERVRAVKFQRVGIAYAAAERALQRGGNLPLLSRRGRVVGRGRVAELPLIHVLGEVLFCHLYCFGLFRYPCST